MAFGRLRGLRSPASVLLGSALFELYSEQTSPRATNERATTPLGASTESDVLAALRDYDTATRAGDIHGQVDFFADAWRSSSGTTKADLREQLRQRADRGGDQDKRFVLDDAKVVVDGDSATVTR